MNKSCLRLKKNDSFKSLSIVLKFLNGVKVKNDTVELYFIFKKRLIRKYY